MVKHRLPLLVSLALVGCFGMEAARPSQVQIARAESHGTTPAELELGRDLFMDRCTICHVAPSPDAEPPAEWPHEIDLMSKRAHLSPDQTHLLAMYLQTVSEE